MKITQEISKCMNCLLDETDILFSKFFGLTVQMTHFSKDKRSGLEV